MLILVVSAFYTGDKKHSFETKHHLKHVVHHTSYTTLNNMLNNLAPTEDGNRPPPLALCIHKSSLNSLLPSLTSLYHFYYTQQSYKRQKNSTVTSHHVEWVHTRVKWPFFFSMWGRAAAAPTCLLSRFQQVLPTSSSMLLLTLIMFR